MSFDSKTVERTAWIDCCKGICIILVVYGHVSGGLEAATALAPCSVWIGLRNWVYLFHMPAFFALSGIFAPKGVQLSFGKFLKGKLRTIFYPYVIWTAIIVGAQFTMIRFVNNPPDLHRALRLFLEPYGYGLWFLYSLFIISLLFYLLRRVKIPPVGVIVIALILCWLAGMECFKFWPIFNTAMSFFIYYAMAACGRDRILQLANSDRRLPFAIFGIVFLLVMTLINWSGWLNGWAAGLLLAWLGVAGVAGLAISLAQTMTCRFWALPGFFSLEIYLGHPLWSTAARALLFKSQVHSPAILLLGIVSIGLGGSLLVGMLCRIGKFPYLFRWPAPARSPAKSI